VNVARERNLESTLYCPDYGVKTMHTKSILRKLHGDILPTYPSIFIRAIREGGSIYDVGERKSASPLIRLFYIKFFHSKATKT